MSSVVIAGDTSGSVTLAAPSVAGTTTLTLPSTSGTVVIGTAPSGAIVGTTDTQTLTNKTLTTPTISSLSSASATALTLQSGGTTGLTIDTSQNLAFNSGYGSVATAYGCRAWVNFNGTGTVAIRSSGNVSSITDNGTGLYTVNFTTAMPDASYATVGSSIGSTTSADGMIVSGTAGGAALAAGSVQVRMAYIGSNVATDITFVNVAVFR